MQIRTRVLCAAAIAASLVCISSPQAAGQQAQFRTSTEVLRIQVGLDDLEGNPASGVNLADLELLVNGEPRRILDLYEIDAAQLRISPDALSDTVEPPPNEGMTTTVLQPTAGSELPTAARRRFLLFFDLGFISRRGLGYARGAAESFLKDIAREGDLVGLATYSGFRGLQYHVPFTSDRDQIMRVVKDLGIGRATESAREDGTLDLQGLAQALALTPAEGVEPEAVLAELSRSAAQLEAGRVILALERMAEEIAPLQGRKHIVYFSEGIPDSLLFDPLTGDAGARRDMMLAMESARRADVAIHSFFPAAMPTSGIHDIRQMTPQDTGQRFQVFADRTYLNYAATETGGETIYFRHQLRRGLEELEESTRKYYVLSFPLERTDREAVSLRVVPKRADVTVSWAPERLALPTWQQHSIMSRQIQVADALEVGNDARSMEVDVLAIKVEREGQYGRVAIAGEIPAHQLRALLEEREEDQLDLEILGVALTPDGTVADYFRTRINLDDVAEQLDRVSIPLRYQNLLAVRPGTYFVKVLVREGVVSRLASRSLRLEIPEADPGDFAIATPLMVVPAVRGSVILGANPNNPANHRKHLPLTYPFVVGAQDLVPVIHPASVAGADVDLFVTVTNPSRQAFDGTTDIAADCWLQDADGNRIVLSDLRGLSSTYNPDTKTQRMLLRLSLPPNVPSGSYSLIVRAHDRLTGVAVGSYTTFVVEPGFERVS